MINKQNLWFITLFSLILILGIYYIALPSEVVTTLSPDIEETTEIVETNESDIIIAMKVEEEEKILAEMEEAQKILLDEATSTSEKNDAYETLQLLNSKKGKTTELEKIIKEEFNLDSCVAIDNNKINIVLSSKDKGKEFANKIIKRIQENYESQMYITVKFQSK